MARLTVKVHPRAKRTAITGRFGEAWKLDLAAPPVDGKANEALIAYLAKHPSSLDAWSLLRQIDSRQSNTKSYLEATFRTCGLHLKAHQIEAAFEDYAEFLDNGGRKMSPPRGWNCARAPKRSSSTSARSPSMRNRQRPVPPSGNR